MSDTRPDDDDQARSEALDDETLGDLDYPPEHPLGTEDDRAAAQGERVDGPAEQRARREQHDPRRPPEGVSLVAGASDLEAELAEEDGPFGDDPDHTPGPAEEAAVHIVDEPS